VVPRQATKGNSALYDASERRGAGHPARRVSKNVPRECAFASAHDLWRSGFKSSLRRRKRLRKRSSEFWTEGGSHGHGRETLEAGALPMAPAKGGQASW